MAAFDVVHGDHRRGPLEQFDPGPPGLEMVPQGGRDVVLTGQLAQLASDVVPTAADESLEVGLSHRKRSRGARLRGRLPPTTWSLEESLQVGERLFVVPLLGRGEDLDRRGQGAEVLARGY